MFIGGIGIGMIMMDVVMCFYDYLRRLFIGGMAMMMGCDLFSMFICGVFWCDGDDDGWMGVFFFSSVNTHCIIQYPPMVEFRRGK